ncbi:MAG TPA: 3-oxo-5-alpha-steroid 4-dehydrogenase [Myxococcota bacterium]|nr:3-oxo-5-alpha-steroid 4-dehydrogenase [Myxococcota bacterium]
MSALLGALGLSPLAGAGGVSALLGALGFSPLAGAGEAWLHRALCWGVLGLSAVTLAALRFVTAPYGRHARPGWGPAVASRTGWLLMESPALLVFAAVYVAGARRAEAAPLALAALWALHYGQRTLVFPFLMRAPARPMPLAVALLGLAFNVVNAYLNARWLSALGAYPAGWLAGARFVAGALLFAGGFALNLHADARLRALRAPGETVYRVPHGGPFALVSCPNYLGEIVEWAGWALATWSLPGLAFAVYTAANLAPRALAHHAWYRRTFPDYPPARKALVPFLL